MIESKKRRERVLQKKAKKFIYKVSKTDENNILYIYNFSYETKETLKTRAKKYGYLKLRDLY